MLGIVHSSIGLQTDSGGNLEVVGMILPGQVIVEVWLVGHSNIKRKILGC